MEQNIINIIATQGAFALLFCYLLFYVLRENSKRENNYQTIIQELTTILPQIEVDIKEIKDKII